MKIVFPILAFIIFQSNSFAQSPYVPFPEGEAVWHVAVRPQYALLPYHDQYMYQGDTLFNGFEYHKIDYTTESVQLPQGNIVYTNEGIIGYLRQDSSLKKVYYVSKIEMTEYLLYDFDLTVGDTIPDALGLVVTSLDSVLVGNSYRRVFVFTIGELDTIKLIEGIGYSSGLLTEAPSCCTEGGIMLACFQENGETVFSPCENCYGSYPYGFCHIVSVNEIENDQQNFSIQPNLISSGEKFNITSSGKSKLEISVFDIFGNVIWKRRFNHDPQIEILSSQFSRGIYFVKIVADDKFLSTQKLVVQ